MRTHNLIVLAAALVLGAGLSAARFRRRAPELVDRGLITPP